MKFKSLFNDIKTLFSNYGFKIGTNSRLTGNRLERAILSGICYFFGILITSILICIVFSFNFSIIFFALFPLPIMMTVDHYWGFTEKCGEEYHRFLIVFLAVISPMLFTISVASSILFLHIYQYGIGLGLALIYPIILLLWNSDAFNDRMTYYGLEKRVDPYPLGLWLSSAIIGGLTTAWGITYLIVGYPSIGMGIFLVVEGLIIQTIFAFPNKVNKLVPVDLEGSNGPYYMLILLLVFLMVIYYVPITILPGPTV